MTHTSPLLKHLASSAVCSMQWSYTYFLWCTTQARKCAVDFAVQLKCHWYCCHILLKRSQTLCTITSSYSGGWYGISEKTAETVRHYISSSTFVCTNKWFGLGGPQRDLQWISFSTFKWGLYRCRRRLLLLVPLTRLLLIYLERPAAMRVLPHVWWKLWAMAKYIYHHSSNRTLCERCTLRRAMMIIRRVKLHSINIVAAVSTIWNNILIYIYICGPDEEQKSYIYHANRFQRHYAYILLMCIWSVHRNTMSLKAFSTTRLCCNLIHLVFKKSFVYASETILARMVYAMRCVGK